MEAGEGPSSVLQDLIVAVCAGDTEGCRTAMAGGAKANTSVSRQHAAIALGPNAFLGSLSWASQDDFPLLYFGGAPEISSSAAACAAHLAA